MSIIRFTVNEKSCRTLENNSDKLGGYITYLLHRQFPEGIEGGITHEFAGKATQFPESFPKAISIDGWHSDAEDYNATLLPGRALLCVQAQDVQRLINDQFFGMVLSTMINQVSHHYTAPHNAAFDLAEHLGCDVGFRLNPSRDPIEVELKGMAVDGGAYTAEYTA